MSEWTFAVDGFDPSAEGWREALFTLANGYLATRGAAPESHADGIHYPGTYVAGCFNRLESEVDGHTVENEDLVNLPNWLPLRFRIDGGQWFDPSLADLLDYHQHLDMRSGAFTRELRYRDAGDRVTAVTQHRLVSMADPHLASLRTTLVAENWSGRLTVRSALDGTVTNAGVERYRDLAGRHLVPLTEGYDGDVSWLEVETSTSRVHVAEAARVSVTGAEAVGRSYNQQSGWVDVELRLDVPRGEQVTVDKTVAVFTSRDRGIEECQRAAVAHVRAAAGHDRLAEHHSRAWSRLWDACRIVIGGAHQASLNLHLFHLCQVVSEHSVDLDVGIPARGLHGEAYRGHIFWDELFVLPLLYVRMPEVARNLLLYRWRRLPAARRAAAAAGLRGAMFPWQSGSDGREETQQKHLNPRSGRWLPDHSRRQRHVGSAIAHNIWRYYEATGDLEFVSRYGAEVLVEIARFWASVAEYDEADDRYDIRGVVGPDEYHDAYPDADEAGVDNNAYTNVMAAWTLCRAFDALDLLPEPRRSKLCEALELGEAELGRMRHVSRRLRVAFQPSRVIDQFEGYHRLAEFDWDGYRAEYGDIHRLDRILEAEGNSPNDFQASKQADVLMLLFVLGQDELTGMFAHLGYEVDAKVLSETLEYYAARTSHGSTLSAVVHAWVLARSDSDESWRFFHQALASDIEDIQGGTTQEGIHLAAMAGTVDLAQRCYTGLSIRDGVLHLDPTLPPELDELEMWLHVRGHEYIDVRCNHDEVEVVLPESTAPPLTVSVAGRTKSLSAGDSWRVPLRRRLLSRIG